MNGFFELMNISYHSSDIHNSSLIVSEKNGTIQFISDKMGSFIPDHFKKHVRFYPVDDFLFTSTDNSIGLRVWDREKEKESYRYPEDSLGVHEYSKNRVIASLSSFGVKFFDIRTRYHISSMSFSLPLGLVWGDEDLYVYNEHSIVKYNILRDKKEEIVVDQGISSVMVSGDDLYYIKVRFMKCYLIKNSLNYEIETVGSNGLTLNGEIYTFGNNEIKMYSKTDSLLTEFKFIKNIEDLKFTKFNTYLFADKKLYIKEGGLTER